MSASVSHPDPNNAVGPSQAAQPGQPGHPHSHARGRAKLEGHIGWFEHTVAGITGSIERSVFTEDHARKEGWLQGIDPRAKLGMFLAVVLAAGLSSSFWVLAGLYVAILLAARASKVPFDFFVKRVWLGIPFFAGIVIIPSIFFTSGQPIFDVTVGSIHIAPSLPGLTGAIVFISRVGVSVSLAVLLVLVTPWSDVLKSLRALHVPQVFVLLLSMTYRYIFLFFRITNGMFEARKSRMVGKTSGNEHRGWITNSMGNLINRSFKMSNDVYAAMLARGFGGEIRAYSSYHMRNRDWQALAGALALALVALLVGRYI